MITKQDTTMLATFVGGAIAAYEIYRYFTRTQPSHLSDWVPVGRIKELYIYPLKSCRGKKVFSVFCDEMGVQHHENRDRMFLAVDQTGHFFTGRVKAQLLLVDATVEDGKLYLSYKEKKLEVDLNEVYQQRKVIQATLHENFRQDGLDCGDEAAKFMSEVLETESRLVVFTPGLYTARTCRPRKEWWRNPVPVRADDSYFVDLAPYMITTQESINELNQQLKREENPIDNVQFRGNIVIEKCQSAWDEDTWGELRFGDHPKATTLECFKPCTRCIFTTIDPKTAIRDPEQQPLKWLKEYRMPEGDLLQGLGAHPIFGVNAGAKIPGYIHEGQTVWARLKPTPF
ncbi:unnamed protein product, partial [Mesorhabditis belari]|uniref:MOSC domain-containing protein n=1 Tax=Mesorhabditis belari TaxID=2138241 RepID=A0AAF3FBS9_9BILA